ncbi:hypothetical protein E2C01_010705 [Portunus trituberculatus]|uniref:Uncharacterized protein n=1 Tax=Portunus trituberculatus TaxID=210409 RepID=A0A5B7D943_PORTR|nr:hypothetical protein [Portunus trituberculatus]
MEVTGNGEQWSEKALQLTMVNTLDHWVEESAQYKEEEEPSVLDLVFTKKPESPPIIRYQSPMGRRNHIT